MVHAAQDFNVQRGSVNFTGTTTNITIVAGTDYDAPNNSSRSFIRITGTHYSGTGPIGVSNVNWNEGTAYMYNPENIDNNVSFIRLLDSRDISLDYEIIEYAGPTGGDNEFIVRDAELMTAASGTTANLTSSVVGGVVNNSRLVAFITSMAADVTSKDPSVFSHIVRWNASAQRVIARRDLATGVPYVSVAAAEFTGSNWYVQDVNHTYTGTGSNEYEKLSKPVNDTSAFIVPSMFASGDGLDEAGDNEWLYNTTDVAYHLQSGATVAHNAHTWIVENTGTTGTAMIRHHVTSTDDAESGGASEYDMDPGYTLAQMNTSSIMSETLRSGGSGPATTRALLSLRLLNETRVHFVTGDAGQTRTFHFDVIEWPTAPAAPSGDTCTYGGSGDWSIDISDNCDISSDINLGVNKLIVYGSGGYLNINANVTTAGGISMLWSGVSSFIVHHFFNIHLQ